MYVLNIDLKTTIKEKLFHMAIGNFDGVHIGHQKIIKKLVKNAKKDNKLSAILSFEPHPRQFFSRDLDRYKIISNKKNIKKKKKLGVSNFFSLKFDESISNLSPTDFISKILVNQMKISKLLVGYNFRFGKNREGNISLLKDHASIHGFNIEIIELEKNNNLNEIYSSSAIREAIKNKEIEKANMMLGHTWSMDGVVIHGDKRAREMNFPTANISPHEQIYPAKGVYAIKTQINKKNYKGIANFGERPTISGKKLLLEVHLFDFDQDIYGNHLTVEFLTFIRDEKKFESFDHLVKQISRDIQVVKNYQLNKKID